MRLTGRQIFNNRRPALLGSVFGGNAPKETGACVFSPPTNQGEYKYLLDLILSQMILDVVPGTVTMTPIVIAGIFIYLL